jgi:riboflavin transporter FmnP
MVIDKKNSTRKIATLGILSALGAVFMLLEIPYPFIPFLTFDISDVVILIIFVIYGWKEAALVGILKALVHILFKGAVGPYAIGQITAFIASMSYVLGMYISTNKFRLNKYLAAFITIVLMTVIMTISNYLFVTPIWFGGFTFVDIQSWVTPEAFGLNVDGGYLVAIIIAYVPFNLLKGLMIMILFFIVDKVLHQVYSFN